MSPSTLTEAEMAESAWEVDDVPAAPVVDHDAESDHHAVLVRTLADLRERQQAGVAELEAVIARCRAAMAEPQRQLEEAQRKLNDLRDGFAESRAVGRIECSIPTQLREAIAKNEIEWNAARNSNPGSVASLRAESLRLRREELKALGKQAMTASQLSKAVTKILWK